jgi:hypothetical protein
MLRDGSTGDVFRRAGQIEGALFWFVAGAARDDAGVQDRP